MAKGKLEITPKSPKGEDGYKTFSIRIKDGLCMRLDTLSAQSGRSRNELIAMLLEFGLDNSELVK